MYIIAKNITAMTTQQHQDLLAAYFSGQATEEEKSEILSLLDSDKDFATAFREMDQAYVAASIPAFEKTKEKDYRSLERRINPVRLSFWRPLAIAASVAAVICLGAALYQFNNSERFLGQANLTTIASTRGTGTETLLPDGTRVCLNAGSSLSFSRSFGRKDRNVTLEGEGYFEVAKDAAKPFRVSAGNATVTVKGTVFNVRSYADEPEICISLLEGAVVLTSPSEEAALKPGTSAFVSRTDGQIRLEKASQSVSSWTKGKITFTDKSIPEILTYLQRNYGVSFVYDDGLFGDERFTGSISSGLSIDEILTYLDVDRKFSWHRTEDTIEIHNK